MLGNGHCLAGQARAPTALLDLPPAVADSDGMILADDPLGWKAEAPAPVATAASAECRAPFGGRRCELRVKFSDVVLAPKTVGFLPVRQARPAQCLRQSPRPSVIAPLPTAWCLRRVGSHHLKAEFLQRSPELRQSASVDGFTGFRRVKEVTAPIAVKR